MKIKAAAAVTATLILAGGLAIPAYASDTVVRSKTCSSGYVPRLYTPLTSSNGADYIKHIWTGAQYKDLGWSYGWSRTTQYTYASGTATGHTLNAGVFYDAGVTITCQSQPV